MKPNEHIDPAMSTALCTMLRAKGIRIASTVAPKEWTPVDEQLTEAAEDERRWNTRSK